MFISDRDVKGNPYFLESPFKTKATKEGTLFRRVHGQTIVLNANGSTTLNFIVPYNKVKINKADFVWLPEGCQADLKVYDSPTSSMQVLVGVPEEYRVPNKLLDQFGFAACISEGYHDEYSEYDADLLKDMKIEVIITNPTAISKTVGVNLIYHEVK
jgi:hypothetical protein